MRLPFLKTRREIEMVKSKENRSGKTPNSDVYIRHFDAHLFKSLGTQN